jgi:hypothetical protein
MTEGKIPVAEALHYAMSLAEALRKMHDAGKFHGAVTPSNIAMTATALELIPSLGPPATVTPYTAPEVLQGQPADARSDIFSFGTLVFEMLTGRPAFDGAGQTELKLAICNAAPPASGSPAVDRLVAGCLAKSPAARWQRMQKILMELKLLTVAARRADAAPPARGVSDSALRSEIQQLEARLAARLAGYDKTIAAMQASAGETIASLKEELAAAHSASGETAASLKEQLAALHRSSGETVAALKEQLSAMQASSGEAVASLKEQLSAVQSSHGETAASLKEQLTAVHASSGETVASLKEQLAGVQSELSAIQQRPEQPRIDVEALTAQIQAHLEETMAALSQKLQAETKETADTRINEAVAGVNQQMAAAEQSGEEIRKHFATLQSNVAADLHDFEKNLKTQSVAIESARTAMAQTDDLVERVVEALELLQSSLIDQHETVGVN